MGGYEGSMGSGMGVGSGGYDSGSAFRPTNTSSKREPSASTRKGMKLGKGSKNDVLEKLKGEGEVVDSEISQASRAAAYVPSEPVSITIDEKLVATLRRDGGVEVLEVNGVMTLEVTSGILPL